MGLVNEVDARRASGSTQAMELAAVIARRPPLAARLAKQAVLAAEETGADRRASRPSAACYELAMATEDRVEGMQAFLEKRKPDFQGAEVSDGERLRARVRRRRPRARGLHASRRATARRAGRRRAARREPLSSSRPGRRIFPYHCAPRPTRRC